MLKLRTGSKISFAKENLFVNIDYDFPSSTASRVPPYYLTAPRKEIEYLTGLAKVIEGVITGPKAAGPCHNDLYNTTVKNDLYNVSTKKPETDAEKLLDAASKGDTATVRSLISAGGKTDVVDEEGSSPLHLAALVRCEETVKTLLDSGANVNARNKAEETPLMIASMFSEMSLINLLIDKGADISARDRYGRNAAFFAISSPPRTYFIMKYPSHEERVETLKRLKAAGVNINERMTLNEDTLLTYEMFSYGVRTRLYTNLIDLGVNINERVSLGQTILIKAVRNTAPSERNKLVGLLLVNNADLSIRDDQGFTALDHAREDQRRRMKMVESRADVAETIRLLEEAAVKR